MTIGYAAKSTQAITTYEYQALHGLNHGLADMHDEVMTYLVPHMLEDASALLGDFVVLYQERNIHRMQILTLERRVTRTRSETEVTEAVLHTEVAGVRQELCQAQGEKEQVEQERNEAHGQLEEVQIELCTAQSQLTKATGDLVCRRTRARKLETELAAVR